MSRLQLARAAAWAGLAVLLGVRVLVPTDTGAEAAMFWAFVWAYLLPLGLTTMATGTLALRLLGTVEHLFWGLLSIATGSILLADAYYGWYTTFVDPMGPAISSWFQALHLVGVVAFFLLVETMTDLRGRSLTSRMRLYLDVLIAMTIAYPVVYLVWTLPAFAAVSDGAAIAAWSALYPVFGAAMIGIVLIVMGGQKSARWRSWERTTVAGVAVFAIGLVSMPVWYSRALATSVIETNWYFAVLGAGAYLAFVATVYRVTAPESEGLGELWPYVAESAGRPRRLYPVLMAAALPALAYLTLRLDPSVSAPVQTSLIALALLLAARSWLVELETAQQHVRVTVDGATGLLSSRYLDERLRQLAEDWRSADTRVAIGVIRIDDFQRLDSLHGRDVGDLLIKTLALVIADRTGRQGEAFRSRFDEFVVLLPGESALVASEQIAAILSEFELSRSVPGAVPVSVSAGVASSSEGASDPADLLTFARVACDRARESGVEQVHVFEPIDIELLGGQEAAAPLSPKWSLGVVRSLAAASDARDPRAAEHSTRVAIMAEALARCARLDSEHAERVRVAGSIHDVGKLAVKRDVLQKTDRWSESERSDFEGHAELGARILRSTGLASYADAVLHHHERWDGTGYPGNLQGAAIPVESRILAVCDSFEALTAGRVTGTPLGPTEALDEIRAGAGTRFDPELAGLFVECVESRFVAERSPGSYPQGR